MGTAESEIRHIRQTVQGLNHRLDALIEGIEAIAMTQLSEHALSSFLSREPNLYSKKDLKVKYQ